MTKESKSMDTFLAVNILKIFVMKNQFDDTLISTTIGKKILVMVETNLYCFI